MTSPANISGAATPWIGDRLYDPVENVVSFLTTGYPIRLVARTDALTWSVPEGTARTFGGKSAFESGLTRITVTASIEAWLFPKLEQEPVHEVVLLLDRALGTASSIELILRRAQNGLRPDIRILRGALAGYPQTYAGFAFPRHKPEARRVSFEINGAIIFLDFDRAGQPSAIGRDQARWRASGHVLHVAPGIWAVAWRTPRTVAMALVNETAGVVNGLMLDVARNAATPFGVHTNVIRSE